MIYNKCAVYFTQKKDILWIMHLFIKQWQHSKECMCHHQNIAMRDYQESVTTRQEAGQSDNYVLLCFAGDIIKLSKLLLSPLLAN